MDPILTPEVTELPFTPKVQPIYGKGTKQSNYYLNLDDQFNRNMLTGYVTENDYSRIITANTQKEPQISKIREKLQQQLKNEVMDDDIPALIMKNRGKGQHNFTIDGFVNECWTVENEEKAKKLIREDKNIFQCEFDEERRREAAEKAKRKPKYIELIDRQSARKNFMIPSKRI